MKFNDSLKILAITLLIMLSSCKMEAQLTIGSVRVDTNSVVTGLDTPWEILWGPDDHIWITERYGRVSRLNPENGELHTLITIDEVHEEGESGLLGMALHPDFSENPHVYLVYNYLSGSSIKEKLVRYTYTNENLSSPHTLIDGIEGSSIHNGSRIVIDSLSKLYFSTGDASVTSYSQDLNSLNGKILRINLDGSIPEDNPFQDSYIWTYGHRNPQGLVISPDGTMYSSEHGPVSDDEVNIIERGRNYGWPDVKGYCDESAEMTFCNNNNVKEPIIAWTPTLAVAGIDYYHHDAIPEWNNSLLMTTLKESELVQISLHDDGRSVKEEKKWYDDWFGRLRDICISPDGRVFMAVSNRDGRGNPEPIDDRIIEIKPTSATSASDVAINETAFKIYPNPAANESFVSLPPGFAGGVLEIYNTQGKKVLSVSDVHHRKKISTEDLSPGVYIVIIEKGLKRIQSKMIIE